MKILASDYDGTFYTRDGQTLRNIEAVKRWREAGNQFGFVTGRALNMIQTPVEQKGIPYDFLICNNGTSIYDREGKLISTGWLSEECVEKLLAAPAVKRALHYALIRTDRTYAVIRSEDSPADQMEFEMTRINEEEVSGLGPFCQISLPYASPEAAAECAEAVNREWGELVHGHLNIDCVDITPAGMDKSVGVESYMELAGVKESDILVVGDGENDVNRIRRFHGYTVDNARPQVKEAASRAYRSVEELIGDYM